MERDIQGTGLLPDGPIVHNMEANFVICNLYTVGGVSIQHVNFFSLKALRIEKS